MIFHARALGALEEILAEPGPACTVVAGRRGLGKTSLVRAAAMDRPALWLRSPDLPAPLQQEELTRSVLRQTPSREAGSGTTDIPEPSVGWPGLFNLLSHRLATTPRNTSAAGTELSPRGDPPALVVWDDVDTVAGQRRWIQALRDFWNAIRAHARPVHLILVARDPHPLQTLEDEGPGTSIPIRTLTLTPPDIREVAATVPDWSITRCVTAFALLGGEPAIWGRMDPSVRLSTNVIRLFLEPGAPLRSLARDLFPLPGRSPGRSLALVHALARGHREWGALREATGVFGTSSELGPYMKALQDDGIMEAHRSLDASPRSRSRRYGLASPFLDFWYSLVSPLLGEVDGGHSPARLWKEAIRPAVPELMTRALPGMVAAHLLRHGDEQLPSAAREAGALWGDGYDLEVAGTLATGAPFYGHTFPEAPDPQAVDRIGEELSHTRYGYGREARLRILFTMDAPSHALERRVARTPTAFLLRPHDLVGGNHPS